MTDKSPAPEMDYGDLVERLRMKAEGRDDDRDIHSLVVCDEASDAIESLVRERDLAIAHDRQDYPTAEAYEKLAAVVNLRTGQRDQAESRADQLAAENERLAAEHTKVHEWNNTLVSHLMQARAALRMVEWEADECLWCHGWRSQGHDADCPRQLALGDAVAARREPKEGAC